MFKINVFLFPLSVHVWQGGASFVFEIVLDFRHGFVHPDPEDPGRMHGTKMVHLRQSRHGLHGASGLGRDLLWM